MPAASLTTSTTCSWPSEGTASLVAASLPEGDPRRSDLQQVLHAADRAAELTHQLLAYSRRQVLRPRVIDPAETVGELEPLLRRLLGDDVEFTVVAEPGLWHVKADPGQLEQVLVNLVMNAHEALRLGGQVTVTQANAVLNEAFALDHPEVPPGPYVRLAVADNGVGMDERTLARAFEPFFTTRAGRGGTGLGLASVYGIVKQSGGFIYAESEPGRGSEFTVYLPRVSGPLSRPHRLEPLEPAAHGSATILVVEADVAVREFERRVLEPLGYDVLGAGSAVQALELAADSSLAIDLLIADVATPEMRGAALASRLRRDRPDLRVLLVSGYTRDALVDRGELEPGVAFLAKPFSGSDLARRVHGICSAEPELRLARPRR